MKRKLRNTEILVPDSANEATIEESRKFTRRDLIRGGAALAAGAATVLAASGCGSATAGEAEDATQADVIVVGGGLSGLQAANTVMAAGHSVILLEARDRIAGRAWTIGVDNNPPSSNAWIDMGGQFVGFNGSGGGQTNVEALIKTLGLQTFNPYGSLPNQGNNIAYYQGAPLPYPSGTDNFPLSEDDLAGFTDAFSALNDMATGTPGVSTINPALDKNQNPSALNVSYDTQTLQSWIDAYVSPTTGASLTVGARFLLRTAVISYISIEAAEISLLHFLFYLAAGQGLGSLHSYGLQYRIIGGVQQLSESLATTLGSAVVLNTQVLTIDYTNPEIEVGAIDIGGNTPKPVTYKAKQVIVALTPTLAGRISYTPGVTANRDGLTQRVPMGATIKVHVVYPTAFWRTATIPGQTGGFSGTVLCDTLTSTTNPSNPIDVNNCEDNCCGTASNPAPGILVAFLWGNSARKWADQAGAYPGQPTAAFQSMVLNSFAAFFATNSSLSPSQFMSPTQFVVGNWQTEDFSRGCYAGYFPPGVWSSYPLGIRQAVGPIHFAGTETATAWYAYMDGALSGGARAGGEAVAAL